jgi:hypothetical protein
MLVQICAGASHPVRFGRVRDVRKTDVCWQCMIQQLALFSPSAAFDRHERCSDFLSVSWGPISRLGHPGLRGMEAAMKMRTCSLGLAAAVLLAASAACSVGHFS